MEFVLSLWHINSTKLYSIWLISFNFINLKIPNIQSFCSCACLYYYQTLSCENLNVQVHVLTIRQLLPVSMQGIIILCKSPYIAAY